jgi:glycosyltransferase involved in cell wall biosynthesis
VRILHILSERGFSGGEEQLLHVLAALAEAGHQSALFLQPGAAFTAHAEKLHIPVHTLRMRNGVDLVAARKLRNVFGRVPCDLIHLADSRAHKLGSLATFGRRPPTMVATRRMDYPLRSGWGTRRLYGRVVAGVIAISEAVRREILRIGIPPERVHLIHDGVDPAAFAGLESERREARAALGLQESDLAILSAASLRPRKGQGHLLRAFASLSEAHPQAQLVLAGEGSERAALESEAERLGVRTRVHLPGRLPGRACLSIGDIACVPSLKEGLSVFSLEAQCVGLPVVASRVGGLPESVADGETGLLVEPGDEGALAVALATLLEDAGLRARMGAAGRARVDAHFSARQMAERTVALYAQLAAAGQPLRPRYS